MSDPRADWPFEWLAFELLRRRDAYRRAWQEFCAAPNELDPNGWAVAFARSVDPARDPAEWFGENFNLPLRLIHSRPYAEPFGLEHLLDPELDAAAHGSIPWRPARGPVPVEFERGPERLTLDETPGQPPVQLWTRFVALRFDLGRPIAPQLEEAKKLLLDAQSKTQEEMPRPSRGRSGANIAAALTALDMHAQGRSAREIGSAINSRTFDPADYGKKLLNTARNISANYLTIASGMALKGENKGG